MDECEQGIVMNVHRFCELFPLLQSYTSSDNFLRSILTLHMTCATCTYMTSSVSTCGYLEC